MKRRPTRASGGEFIAPLQPSPALAAIIGSEAQPRTEVTARLWSYIVEH
jgi:chromatin remodeling complex protein RSC6